ncbi:pr70.1 [rat cytomegalovirus strain Maastricht]|uniref:Pr70.1 n=1 Tax=Rat cytomegalovirus (strain Maastricht) TaxID=79700 RepID=Q9DWD3_RCMVM|nr:pr70.1 [rat cytomegalovirus strain Maastricht]AAF99157.1 pr70.1 [rat cytomegalovirus strain Maastricht]
MDRENSRRLMDPGAEEVADLEADAAAASEALLRELEVAPSVPDTPPGFGEGDEEDPGERAEAGRDERRRRGPARKGASLSAGPPAGRRAAADGDEAARRALESTV